MRALPSHSLCVQHTGSLTPVDPFTCREKRPQAGRPWRRIQSWSMQLPNTLRLCQRVTIDGQVTEARNQRDSGERQRMRLSASVQYQGMLTVRKAGLKII